MRQKVLVILALAATFTTAPSIADEVKPELSVRRLAQHEMKLKNRIGELEQRVSMIEKKMSHVVRILKLVKEK